MLCHPFHERRYAIQCNMNNVPADDHSTYYRCCISVPLVDQLLVEIQDTTFSPHHRVALLGICLVYSAFAILPDPDVNSHLAKLVDLYEEYLVSQESASHQMEQHGKSCLPTSPSHALPHATSLCPAVRVLLLVICTLPVTISDIISYFESEQKHTVPEIHVR